MEEITKLLIENENLIYSVASKFTKYKDKEDLFQAGCIGMMEAYKNFDKTKGTKFTTYAYPYIFGEINKYVREDHTIKLSKDMQKLKSKIEKASNILSQKLMHTPNTKELSDYLEIDEETISYLLNYNDPCSIDKEIDDVSMHEIIPDKIVDYNTLIALKTEIEYLEEPERTIMIERYYNDITQTELSKRLGLSQVDISRREKKVLTKLKKTFN
ncbi:MAG: sigma-70 family RNA polymerase sigma factor [Bacilli bacterium]|nr:sigma-70 family RNA polymerase sigma factor [Bacilli bacterium]